MFGFTWIEDPWYTFSEIIPISLLLYMIIMLP